jgi:hypothetical protein
MKEKTMTLPIENTYIAMNTDRHYQPGKVLGSVELNGNLVLVIGFDDRMLLQTDVDEIETQSYWRNEELAKKECDELNADLGAVVRIA